MPIMGNLSYVQYAITAAAGAIMAVNGIIDIGTIGSFYSIQDRFPIPLPKYPSR